MIRAVILLVLAACASSKSAEQHAEVAAETHTEAQAAQTLQQETHSEEGEWTRRTWEFVGPVVPGPHVVNPAKHSDAAGVEVQGPPEVNIGVDDPGPLLRYTEETHAPAHVDTSTVLAATQQGTQSSTLNASSEAHSASKWRVGLPWLSLAALALGLLWAWKTGWLGKGLSLLGRIF